MPTYIKLAQPNTNLPPTGIFIKCESEFGLPWRRYGTRIIRDNCTQIDIVLIYKG